MVSSTYVANGFTASSDDDDSVDTALVLGIVIPVSVVLIVVVIIIVVKVTRKPRGVAEVSEPPIHVEAVEREDTANNFKVDRR